MKIKGKIEKLQNKVSILNKKLLTERIEFLVNGASAATKFSNHNMIPKGWKGPGWYIWKNSRKELLGPFGAEDLAIEWLKKESRGQKIKEFIMMIAIGLLEMD